MNYSFFRNNATKTRVLNILESNLPPFIISPFFPYPCQPFPNILSQFMISALFALEQETFFHPQNSSVRKILGKN